MAYPDTIDSFTALVDGVDKIVASHPNALQTAVTAIENHLGTTTAPKVNAQIQLLGGSIIPTVTNGCVTPVIIEMSTNKNCIKVPAFAKDVDQMGDFWHELPSDYGGGTITFHVNWTHAATTTNFKVAWALKAVAIADDGTLDVAYGTAVQVNDTGGTTYDHYQTPESAPLTIAGTPLAGKVVNWRLTRVGTDGTNDTNDANAYPEGVVITYTRTA
jgi:hypothetical protein